MALFVANWKSNKTRSDIDSWFDEYASLADSSSKDASVVVCPSFLHVSYVQEKIDEYGLDILLGAQTLSPFSMGAYTGAVSGSQISEHASYVIVGHSERRNYFGETSEVVGRQVEQALLAELTPIVCVDEPYIDEQLNFLDDGWCSRLIFAFEPLTSIGTGNPDSPEHANSVAKQIRSRAGDVTVLYGGSVDETLAAYYLNHSDIGGVLVGGVSLEGKRFAEMVQTSTHQ